MRPFVSIVARACPLPLANIDTDQLIPARFMRRPRAEGYENFLLHDLRRGADGAPDPAFPLNDESYRGAEALVARRNFGGGSSREAAVYALLDYGFRVVIAPSFGDIFSSNAVKNGLLPARVAESEAETLLAELADGGLTTLSVDLAAQTLSAGERVIPFEIEPVWKRQLLNGWDDIDLTLAETPALTAFRAHDEAARPWARPRRRSS